MLTLFNNNKKIFLLLLLLSFICFKSIVVILLEMTHISLMILNDRNSFLIFDLFNYIILSLCLFFIETHTNAIILAISLNYVGESLGWPLIFTLSIRYYFLFDGH